MKYYAILLVAVALYACKDKTEGCKDLLALNYDSVAEEGNNSLCMYSTTTFYAGSNTVFGQPVSEITLEVNNEVIGKISQLSLPAPTDCDQPGTLKYEIKTGQAQVWFATYTLSAGGEVTQQGDFAPDSQQACLVIDLMP